MDTNLPNSSSSHQHGESMQISTGKEQEIIPSPQTEAVIPVELQEAGVEVRKENIDIPLDIERFGVLPTGAAQSVSIQSSFGTVTLPISDDVVVKGLHENILSSLRWLAEICMKQLKRVHFTLRVIHGKVFRVSYAS